MSVLAGIFCALPNSYTRGGTGCRLQVASHSVVPPNIDDQGKENKITVLSANHFLSYIMFQSLIQLGLSLIDKFNTILCSLVFR